MMGYDLSSSNGGYFRANIDMFSYCQQLGQAYGWQPAGTKWNRDVYEVMALGHAEHTGEPYDAEAEAERARQAEAEWRGGYWSNDFQIVTADDAAAWADALERALDDLPDHNALAHLEREITFPGGLTMTVLPNDAQYTMFEYLSGSNKEYLREFIDFCRLGEFRIG